MKERENNSKTHRGKKERKEEGFDARDGDNFAEGHGIIFQHAWDFKSHKERGKRPHLANLVHVNEFFILDFHDAVGYFLNEVAIVGYGKNGSVVVQERILNDFARVNI